MSQLLSVSQDIRYTKLSFTIQFTEDTVLPKQKVSAIRGGIGEMLLRANCVRDRECDTCDFSEECIVQRIMYSKYEKKPSFVTTGESIGYVIECENYEEIFEQSDTMNFQLLLLGKNIVYFNQYLQAVSMLGLSGLGKHQAHFVVAGVKNQCNQDILIRSSVNMQNYRISNIGEYISYRMRQLQKKQQKDQIEDISEKGLAWSGTLVFRTPFTVKYQGEFIRRLHMDSIIASVRRRLYMLDCFEGIEAEVFWEETPEAAVTESQQSRQESISRYSNRRESAMILRGIQGSIRFSGADLETVKLLLAGELIHVGKNTSFGFGEYRVFI